MFNYSEEETYLKLKHKVDYYCAHAALMGLCEIITPKYIESSPNIEDIPEIVELLSKLNWTVAEFEEEFEKRIKHDIK